MNLVCYFAIETVSSFCHI